MEYRGNFDIAVSPQTSQKELAVPVRPCFNDKDPCLFVYNFGDNRAFVVMLVGLACKRLDLDAIPDRALNLFTNRESQHRMAAAEMYLLAGDELVFAVEFDLCIPVVITVAADRYMHRCRLIDIDEMGTKAGDNINILGLNTCTDTCRPDGHFLRTKIAGGTRYRRHAVGSIIPAVTDQQDTTQLVILVGI